MGLNFKATLKETNKQMDGTITKNLQRRNFYQINGKSYDSKTFHKLFKDIQL